jgi:hypothetical protein
MTLNLQAIAFLLGAGLIIAAIVGGGLEIRDLRVPPMRPVARTLAAVFGALLMIGATPVGLAVWNKVNSSSSAVAATENTKKVIKTNTDTEAMNIVAPAPAPGSTLIPAIAEVPDREVTVADLLGTHQRYERVAVRVNGRSVGVLSIDQSNPSDSLSFRVRGGDTYELSGNDAVYVDGELKGRSITGSGTFSSRDDRRHYRLWQVSRDDAVLTIELRAD